MLIGFSTGALYKNVEPISVEAIELIRKTGCNAIELNAGKEERLQNLDNISKNDLKDFNYVSFHAPFNLFELDYESILNKISKAQKKFKFNRIVIELRKKDNYNFIKNSNLPIAFENITPENGFFSNIEEIREISANNDFDLILDLTHACLTDSTLKLIHDFHNFFKNQIVQYHISGCDFNKVSGGHHSLLHISKQVELIKSIKLNKPIIIESVFPVCDNREILEKNMIDELNYVKENLNYGKII